MWELVVAVLLLLIASAICSGTEAAIFSLPIAKARQLAEKGRNGQIVHNIRDNPARPISTIVIFNNLANIVGTYFVAYLATDALSGNMQAWFPFLLTAMVIIFSEIIPKTIGERLCVAITSFMARPLMVATWLLTPVVWAIEILTGLFVGRKPRQVTSEHEIKALARIGHQEGVIDADESRMIGKIFELDDRTAEDIMTPRTAITWIRSFEPVSTAAEKIADSQHSRILVVGETIDDIKGVFLKSKMLQLLLNGHEKDAVIEDHMEQVQAFSENTPADELLEYFKRSRIHLAVVVDEYGGVSGVVTLEDVLEVLTGEIVDETDTDVDMREYARKNGVIRIEQISRSASSTPGNTPNSHQGQ
jgi:CBS domain containing-hemolysin-like protein